AGGLAAWMASGAAPAGHGGEDDDECRTWRWLAQHGRQARPEIHLGYGLSDRFADGQRLMASALPAARGEAIGGKHDWPTSASLALAAGRLHRRPCGPDLCRPVAAQQPARRELDPAAARSRRARRDRADHR